MVALDLSVIDLPYSGEPDAPKPRVGKKGKPRKGAAKKPQLQSTTTYEVATILEAKYGVMAHFVERHHDDIEQAMITSIEGALEDLFAGAPMHNPFAEADSAIQAEFRTFLMTAEIETMGVDGVPTQAAIDRRSGRFKTKVGPSQRPSFIDSGTYELSMIAQIK